MYDKTISILIPTTPDREGFMIPLMRELRKQIGECDAWSRVEILVELDNYENTIGWKRNRLLDRADGEYLAYFDSDDMPFPSYIKRNLEVAASGFDCGSLTGVITENGLNPLVFQHSIKYKKYETVGSGAHNPGIPVRYLRFPNHLNLIRSDIAKQFTFPLKNHGEDTDFATQIFKSGLLKTEYWIEEPIYQYLWRKK